MVSLKELVWSVPCSLLVMSFSVTFCLLWALVWLICAPFGEEVVRKQRDRLYAMYAWIFAFFFQTWLKTEYYYYGDPLPMLNENIVLLANHQCSVDWVLLEILSLQAGAGGHMRYIMKESLRFMPLYGFILMHHYGIFLKRKGGKDKKRIEKQLQIMSQKGVPAWVCMFPEGTRFDARKTEKLEKSNAYAEDHGLPKLSHLLTPRTTGFETVMSVGRDYFKAVYDVTIFYEGFGNGEDNSGKTANPPNVFSFVGGGCKRVHIHLHRTDVEKLPADNDGLKDWLLSRYVDKDKWLAELCNDNITEAPKPNYVSNVQSSLGFVVAMVSFLFYVFFPTGPLIWGLLLIGFIALGCLQALTITSF